MAEISAVIITLNEERNIKRCVESLQSVVEEVIVLDSGSNDRTKSICEELGVKFQEMSWKGYAAQKNYANSLASKEYVLSIDADEVLSSELKEAILEVKAGLSGIYGFHRLTNYCGHWVKHSGWYPDTKWRLFPKDSAKWTGDFVHEELEFVGSPKRTLLKGDLHHYSYSNTGEHRLRADKYSALTAKKMFERGKSASPIKPLLSAAGRWLKMYILQRGFLDGWAGKKIAAVSAASNVFKYRELRRLNKSAQRSIEIRTIALSRTDSIGDVMLSLPMAGIIKAEWPNTRIIFIGRSYTESVIRCCEHVDTFMDYDDLKNLSSSERNLVLKSENIDAFVHVFPRSDIASWAKKAGVKIRIGTGRRLFNLFTCNYKTWFSRKKSLLHEAELNAMLLGEIDLPTYFNKEELAKFSGFSRIPELPANLTDLIREDKKKVILHPKSRGSAVEWSIDNYAILLKRLSNEGFQVFITGTEAERALIGNNFPWDDSALVDLTGKLSLTELIAFISKCDALVAASTGPLHIAAACDILAIGLYTPQRPMHPGRWSPIGKNVKVLTALSHPVKGQSLDISVDNVLALLQS